MDDFAFPDEENLLKMQKEYEKVLGGKNVVSSLSLSKNGRLSEQLFFDDADFGVDDKSDSVQIIAVWGFVFEIPETFFVKLIEKFINVDAARFALLKRRDNLFFDDFFHRGDDFFGQTFRNLVNGKIFPSPSFSEIRAFISTSAKTLGTPPFTSVLYFVFLLVICNPKISPSTLTVSPPFLRSYFI